MKKIVLAGLFLLSCFAVSAQAVNHHRWPIDYFASPEVSAWYDHATSGTPNLRYDSVLILSSDPAWYNWPVYGRHHGTDIKWNGTSTSVRAGALGSLYYRQDGCGNNPPSSDTACYGYGNHVRILHPDGKVTIYAHLQAGSVSGLASNLCGYQVGIMGNSGTSEATHLHLEMWSDIYATQRIDHFGGSSSGLVYWVSQNANGYGKPSMVCE